MVGCKGRDAHEQHEGILRKIYQILTLCSVASAPNGVVAACADAELDDAAYDANMRSAVSGSLSETADRLPSSSDSSFVGDASDSDDAHSDAEVAEGVLPQAEAGGSALRAPQGGPKIAAQRTRSWDDSVEEGMASIDADFPIDADADKRCEAITDAIDMLMMPGLHGDMHAELSLCSLPAQSR